MPRYFIPQLYALCLVVIIASGCATPLPPTYSISQSGAPEGQILALAGEGELVAMVSKEGLFLKKAGGSWTSQEVPGLRSYGEVTCLAVKDGDIYLGSDGEGLHIFSGGSWEVRTSRYGGLPDDGVLSIAVDGPEEGLGGESIWVGTRQGIAALRDGEWILYQPGSQWLVSLSGGSGVGAGKVFVGPGFRLGAKGDDSSKFQPPVSAIGVGPDQIVFGNNGSDLALVRENSVAVLKLGAEQEFRHLEIGDGVIWAGTDKGLVWGGLRGQAEGKPWPVNRAYINWSGTLFGSRNTADFEYRWKLLGYNTAQVVGLEKRGSDVWAAYRDTGSGRHALDRKRWATNDTELMPTDPISDVRRYVNVDEYIARKQRPQHESYGSGADIRGEPTALYMTPDGNKVWIGTTRGLWELEQ